MSTVEGMLIAYGMPVNGAIITKAAAINAAQGLMQRVMITSYRIEEETETAGKIIVSMEASGHLNKALQANAAFNDGLWAVQNLRPYDASDLQQIKGSLLRLGEEQP